MIPFLLAGLGGYLLGSSSKRTFASGGDLGREISVQFYRKVATRGGETMDQLIRTEILSGSLDDITTKVKSQLAQEGADFANLIDRKAEGIVAKVFKDKETIKYADGGEVSADDEVVMKFKQDTWLEIFEDEDEPSREELFQSGEMFEVTILEADDIRYAIQFPDGSVAYVGKGEVEVVAINDEVMAYRNGGKLKKGGKTEIVVTKIKDIPNLKEALAQKAVTYRGLGMGKLSSDFYDKAGEGGTRIKVYGKEYFITDKEFDKIARDKKGNLIIEFNAPSR